MFDIICTSRLVIKLWTTSFHSIRCYHNHLNNYGHAPSVGEEETLKNIDKVVGFNNIYSYDGNVVADVRWEDCEPWDTVRVPVKLIRTNVPTTLYEYWK